MGWFSGIKKIAKAHVKVGLMPFRAATAVTKASTRFSPHAIVVRKLRAAAKRAPRTPIRRAPAAQPGTSWAGGGGAGGGGGGGGGGGADDVDALTPENTEDDSTGYDAGDDAGDDQPANDGGEEMGGLAGWMDAFRGRGQRTMMVQAARLTPQQRARLVAKLKNAAAFASAGRSLSAGRSVGVGRKPLPSWAAYATPKKVGHTFGLWGADDDQDLGAIDYESYLDGGGLAGWTDDLLNIGKGAVSGALTSGASILTAADRQKAAAAAAASQQPAGMSMPVKVAIGGGALALLYVLTRKRSPATAAA